MVIQLAQAARALGVHAPGINAWIPGFAHTRDPPGAFALGLDLQQSYPERLGRELRAQFFNPVGSGSGNPEPEMLDLTILDP